MAQLSTDELESLIADGIEILVAREPDADLFVQGALDEAQLTRQASEKPLAVH